MCAMLIQHVLVVVLVFSMPNGSMQQCPADTLIRLHYNNTVSMVGMASISNEIPKCSNSTDPSQCCDCEADELACPSIDSALDYVNTFGKMSAINGFELVLGKDNATSQLNLSTSYNLQSFDSVSISGLGQTTVNCAEGAGIVFNSSMSVAIWNLSWYGCGPVAATHSKESQKYFASGLVFLDCIQVMIMNACFDRFRGSAIRFDVHTFPDAQCDYDTCSTIVSEQEGFQYRIENSRFVHNGKIPSYYNNFKLNGGAIHVSFSTFQAKSITIVNATFESNEAAVGGAMFYNGLNLHPYNNCSQSLLSIENSYFLDNCASGNGGALLIINNEGHFDNCTFENNSAGVGGGVHYTLSDDMHSCPEFDSHRSIVFQSCTWLRNRAQASAALYFGTTFGTIFVDILLKNSTFTANAVNQIYFFDESACVIYLGLVTAVFNSIQSKQNIGSALCLDESSITLKGNNFFSGNQGFKGGSVFIQTSSEILLEAGQSLEFKDNTALYGGAIYQNVILPQAVICVFGFPSENGTRDNDTFVKFVNNTAFISGNSVYFVNATKVCQDTFSHPQLQFIPNNSHQLSSSAEKIQFLDPIYEENGEPVINVTLGVQIPLNAIVLDFMKQPTLTAVNAYLQNDQNQATPYVIVGSPSFTITNGSNLPNLSIAGPQIHNEFLTPYRLVLITPNIEKSIQLYMKPCPLGLFYDEFLQKCICYEEDELVCINETATVCIQDSYWLGIVNGNYTVSLCSFGLCSTAYGVCTECPVDGASSYCQINGTNSVCVGNHNGTLCGDCVEGFAPGFLSLHCIDSSSCDNVNVFYLFMVNMAFIAIVLCLFVIILKLDYRIGSGYLFGVFYYYSIVIHLLPPNAVGESMLVTVAVLLEVTQLNPKLLGYIDLCFSSSNWTIVEYALCYLNPLTLAIFIFVIIRLSKCCPRVVTFSDSTLVRAICLLAISSFGTLTEISFNIISPVILEGLDGAHVNIQPSVEYLDPDQHLPWFIISILVILGLIIPFTLLLFFAPLLVRCINMNRIKPFLDEFQGCYKDKFRWMAGFYFLCRIIYLALLTSATAGLKTTQYGVQFLSLIILLIHVILQPYKNRFLNILDSVILADLMILTLLFGQTANLVFSFTEGVRLSLTFMLVVIPVLYVLFLSFLAIVTRLSRKYTYTIDANLFFRTFRMPNTGKTETSSVTPVRQLLLEHEDRSERYRESLLSLVEDTERNGSFHEGHSRPVTPEYHSLSDQPIAVGASATTAIKKHQTVIERPMHSMTHSLVFDNGVTSYS